MEKVTWDKLKPALVKAARDERYRHSYKNAVVKEADGKIVGLCFGFKGGSDHDTYLSLAPILEEFDLPAFDTFNPSETLKGEWYLDSLVTDPAFRGQGIGNELIEAACRKARASGVSFIGLNVDHGNPRAKKLYERLGFRKSGEIVIVDHRYDHMQKQL